MKKIIKTAIVSLAAASALVSCQKEFEYVFAEEGPDMTVESSSEAAYMGGRLTFSVNVSDSDFDLSTLKAQLLFDKDVVADTTIRTKTNGTYEGWLNVPFLKDIPDGNASLVFLAQNVGQAITADTVYVAVTRPEFEYLTLTTTDGTEYRMMPTGEKHTYAVEDDFPAQCNATIKTTPVPDTDNVLNFGWASGAVALDATGEIPFSYSQRGYTITFNTMTFEASPLVTIEVNGQPMEMVTAGNYTVTLDLEQHGALTVTGIDLMEFVSSYYLDPDYLTVGGTGASFNATSGKYRIDLSTSAKTVEFTKVKEDGSDATLAEGALWMLGWGVANPVMTSQIGFEEKTAWCLAEVEPLVFQFTGIAVEETDGTTLGGRFRYDYISAKYFAQNAWGNEAGKIFGSENTIEVEGNAAEYVKLSSSNNIELAENLELGATYRLTIDLTKAESEGIEIVRFDKL